MDEREGGVVGDMAACVFATPPVLVSSPPPDAVFSTRLPTHTAFRVWDVFVLVGTEGACCVAALYLFLVIALVSGWRAPALSSACGGVTAQAAQ